ncbi:MAG: 50S ribosomal protein L13 [Nanoarchaeota archaeon]|nr:50S ribosomal protein L13 [Nanoarchaeota archaeon]MBU1269915.1 50S ribosomal protein L13 [Nanoarchaeota archaeon]MBU1604156.1 50S ribosomal protein L13 [Nanoarchaeota archaeon]MBU2442499.1 50S ribosomal protein L13 [Nanoarchaeota archaeon]
MIIDATNLIIGRMSTFIAKKALQGEQIDIINSEKAVITGDKKKLMAAYRRKREFGAPLVGPYFPRQPDKFVKRTIRGMLPYKQPRGLAAFKNIKCYVGVPEELKDKKPETIKEASIEKLSNIKYLTVNEICKSMGATL